MRHRPSRRPWRTAVPVVSVALAVPLLFASCREDPELTAKRDSQRVEIVRLEGQLEILRARLADLPKDRSEELAEMRAKTKAQQAEIEELEAEVIALEKEQGELEKEFEAYRRKYVIR